MKVLYYGGQKSGKSRLAEAKTLELSEEAKPYYLATYDNSYNDEEMAKRIEIHKLQRQEQFHTIEESLELALVIQEKESYLIDCISMWILNTLEKPIEELFEELEALEKKEANMVFVLNNVSSGVIPFEKESRAFVDRTGIIGQKLASICDEVYEVKLGLERRLK